MSDIVIVPTHELGLKHLQPTNIVCSGYTTKHIFKVCKDLCVEIKKLNLANFKNSHLLSGRKDSEWFNIDVGEISINFFVESLRKDFRLEEVWLDPLTKEEVEFKQKLHNKEVTKKYRL